MKLFFTDTETTGLSAKPGMHELTQLGGIITDNRNILDTIYLTSKPQNWDKISKQALEVTNTTIAMLEAYQEPKKSFDEFYQFVTKNFDGTRFRFAGQNVKFDIRFIEFWWNTWRSGDQKHFTQIFDPENPFELMDITKKLQKLGILIVDNVKLGTVANALMITPSGSLHNAMTDIDLTYKVFFNILDRLKMLNNADIEDSFARFLAIA